MTEQVTRRRRKKSKEASENQTDRSELLSKLSQVAPATTNAGSIASFKHIWFDGECLIAFNGELGVIVEYKSPLALGAPADTLLKLCKTGAGELELIPEDGALVVKSGRSRPRIVTLDLDSLHWPYDEDENPSKEVVALEITEEFLDGLRRTLLIKPRQPTRTEQHGITVFPLEKGAAGLYCTDGRVMIEVRVEMKLPRGAVKFVLPRSFAEQVVAQCAEGSVLHICEDRLIAEATNATLFCNLLDASGVVDMPSIVKGFATGASETAKMPAGFNDALDRAEILSDDNEPTVTLNVDGNTLSIEGQYSLGALDEGFPLDTKLPKSSISLLGMQLKKALAESDRFGITDRAAVFFGGDDFIFLVANKS